MSSTAMRLHRRVLACVVAGALAVTACGSEGGAPTATTSGAAPTGTLTVAAAASLTAPFEAIGEAFREANPGMTEVRFTFDSSSTLARQIEEGAPADVFASADEVTVATLTDAGLVSGPAKVFAANELTIVVKAGNPTGIDSLADLATAGTIALCGSEAPCGRYAEEVLARAGVTIPETSVTRAQNAKATYAAVAEGDAVAAIVYVTDVTGSATEAIPLPAGGNVVATYPAARVSAAENPTAADAFIAFLLADEAQETLRGAGFLPPPPPT